MSKWIRKGDQVLVIAGNEKGNQGKVLVRRGDKIVVEGLNKRTKHVKRSQANPNGGRIQFEAPIHVSNVAMCNENGQKIKVSVRVGSDGAKELVGKFEGEESVIRVLKKAKESK